MSAINKYPRPANDLLHPRASQPMPYVTLSRSGKNGVRFTVAAVVCAALIAGAAVLFYTSQASTQTAEPLSKIAAAPAPLPKIFDITLNAGAPEPKQADEPLAPLEQSSNNVSPQKFDVAVEQDNDDESKRAQPASHPQGKADDQQTLHIQYRAAELAPSNMMYRLQLAISYDRAGKNAGALQLYRQVLQAYDQQDASLPASLDIDGIRRRADYLASITE